MVVVVVSLAAVVVAIFWLILTANHPGSQAQPGEAKRLLTVDRPFPGEGRFPGDPYVGPQVCAECHPGEAALHARSGHALTLRPAERRILARRLDGMTITDPERPNATWSYQFLEGRLQIRRRAPGQVERWIVDYAFGSGHHATTFVNVLDPSIPTILEHRLTYYTRENVLGITPGQDAHLRTPGVTPHGLEPAPRESRKCFGCHSTQIAARGDQQIDEATMIPNVSCERCHGPGRAHVVAARRGGVESELSPPFGTDNWTAEALLKMCGACHRHPSRARPGQIRRDDPHLARFQPVGLMQSECYQRSAGALSCVTCHDPHARASSNRTSYDKICIECHRSRVTSTDAAHDLAATGVVCGVSPRQRCVECHMPKVESGQHILFSDHWIRIRRKGETSSTARPPESRPAFTDRDEP